MKRAFLGIIAVCAILGVLGVGTSMAVSPQNKLYTHAISTGAITDASFGADISSPTVLIKGVSISNPSATAQTVTIYAFGNSTSTAVAVYTFDVPGSRGTYSIVELQASNMNAFNADLTNIPQFTIRTSTTSTAAAAVVNVKYWQ